MTHAQMWLRIYTESLFGQSNPLWLSSKLSKCFDSVPTQHTVQIVAAIALLATFATSVRVWMHCNSRQHHQMDRKTLLNEEEPRLLLFPGKINRRRLCCRLQPHPEECRLESAVQVNVTTGSLARILLSLRIYWTAVPWVQTSVSPSLATDHRQLINSLRRRWNMARLHWMERKTDWRNLGSTVAVLFPTDLGPDDQEQDVRYGFCLFIRLPGSFKK